MNSETRKGLGEGKLTFRGLDAMVVWLAQGLGVGRIPVAPGTFGSLLGLGWLAALLASGSVVVFWGGIVAGFFVSVWFCGRAERILGRADPPSIVLDEISAMPVCFLPWIFLSFWDRHHHLPSAVEFFTAKSWAITFGHFLLFRLFDIWKPAPIRQSQRLPGGWGVTTDDFLAGGYVALIVLCVLFVGSFFSRP